jgi:hypothetical protein
LLLESQKTKVETERMDIQVSLTEQIKNLQATGKDLKISD